MYARTYAWCLTVCVFNLEVYMYIQNVYLGSCGNYSQSFCPNCHGNFAPTAEKIPKVEANSLTAFDRNRNSKY